MRKVPCCKGFHTLWFISGENKRHRSVHPDTLIFTLFILRRYCRDPRPMNFAFFHTKGATGLLLTSPQRCDPGPRWGQKRANQRSISYIDSLEIVSFRCVSVVFSAQKESRLSHILVFLSNQKMPHIFIEPFCLWTFRNYIIPIVTHSFN